MVAFTDQKVIIRMTLGVQRYCKIRDLTRSAACARFRLPAETSDPVEVVGQGKFEVDVLLEVDVEVSNLGPFVRKMKRSLLSSQVLRKITQMPQFV